MMSGFVMTSVDGHNRLVEISSDPQIKRKRHRPSISCMLCKRRKVKCDRARPTCGTCKKSGMPTKMCVYSDCNSQNVTVTAHLDDSFVLEKNRALLAEISQLRQQVQTLQGQLSSSNEGDVKFKPLQNIAPIICTNTNGIYSCFGPVSWRTVYVQTPELQEFFVNVARYLDEELIEWEDQCAAAMALKTGPILNKLYGSGDPLENFVEQVEEMLPPYDQFESTVMHYMARICVPTQCVDPTFIVNSFKKFFYKQANGKVGISATRPEEILECCVVVLGSKYNIFIDYDGRFPELVGYDKDNMLVWLVERGLEICDHWKYRSYYTVTCWAFMVMLTSMDMEAPIFELSQSFNTAIQNAVGSAYSVGVHHYGSKYYTNVAPISKAANEALWLIISFADTTRSLSMGQPMLTQNKAARPLFSSDFATTMQGCVQLVEETCSKMNDAVNPVKLAEMEDLADRIGQYVMAKGLTLIEMATLPGDKTEIDSFHSPVRLKCCLQLCEALFCVYSHAYIVAATNLQNNSSELTSEERVQLLELMRYYKKESLRMGVFNMTLVSALTTSLRGEVQESKVSFFLPQLRRLYRRAVSMVSSYFADQYNKNLQYPPSKFSVLVDNVNVDQLQRIVFIKQLPDTPGLSEMKEEFDKAISNPMSLIVLVSGITFNIEKTSMGKDHVFSVGTRYMKLLCDYAKKTSADQQFRKIDVLSPEFMSALLRR